MDRGDWEATVPRVAKSWARLKPHIMPVIDKLQLEQPGCMIQGRNQGGCVSFGLCEAGLWILDIPS